MQGSFDCGCASHSRSTTFAQDDRVGDAEIVLLTIVLESCIHIGFGKLWIGAPVKLNRQTDKLEQNSSGAKARVNLNTLIAALNRCSTPKHFFVRPYLSVVLAFLLTGFAASAQGQDKGADMTAVPAP